LCIRAQEDREQALQDLKDGTVKVLIATGKEFVYSVLWIRIRKKLGKFGRVSKNKS
jgi:hydroxymethylpyrimidine pyrophosphatase-like HAD family hydrolase